MCHRPFVEQRFFDRLAIGDGEHFVEYQNLGDVAVEGVSIVVAADDELGALMDVGFGCEHGRRCHGNSIHPNDTVASVAVAGNHVPDIVPPGGLEGGDIAAGGGIADLKAERVVVGGVQVEALFVAAAPGQRGRSVVTAKLPLNHEDADGVAAEEVGAEDVAPGQPVISELQGGQPIECIGQHGGPAVCVGLFKVVAPGRLIGPSADPVLSIQGDPGVGFEPKGQVGAGPRLRVRSEQPHQAQSPELRDSPDRSKGGVDNWVGGSCCLHGKCRRDRIGSLRISFRPGCS